MNDPTQHTALYDLAPALWLMGLGLLLAAGPLAWVLLRNRHGGAERSQRRLQALTVLTLFLTFDLILFGAFTRLTDSGLGCPDWPGCYGQASPAGASAQIGVAQEVMPTGPVTYSKAWIEMIHRYLATTVGALIVALTIMSWRARARGGLISPWWAMFTLFWVCVQGAFGALTVTMRLFPAIVTMHLLGGLLLLALLGVQSVWYRQASGMAPLFTRTLPGRGWLWFALLLLVAQIGLGGWVSANYAVLACNEFPQCQGSWWPQMNFEQGFTFWRDLGMTGVGEGSEPITFAALTAIHYTHRLVAYLVIAVLLLLAWRMLRQSAWRSTGRALLLLVLLQFATGLSNVVLGWPLVAALMHTGGAAALMLVLVRALAGSRRT